MDRLSGMFIEGGFTADLTHHVMHALGHRIWGFSPEAFDDPDSLQPPVDPAAREATVQVVQQQTYPYIAMIALNAFEWLHEAGWRSAR